MFTLANKRAKVLLAQCPYFLRSGETDQARASGTFVKVLRCRPSQGTGCRGEGSWEARGFDCEGSDQAASSALRPPSAARKPAAASALRGIGRSEIVAGAQSRHYVTIRTPMFTILLRGSTLNSLFKKSGHQLTKNAAVAAAAARKSGGPNYALWSNLAHFTLHCSHIGLQLNGKDRRPEQTRPRKQSARVEFECKWYQYVKGTRVRLDFVTIQNN